MESGIGTEATLRLCMLSRGRRAVGCITKPQSPPPVAHFLQHGSPKVPQPSESVPPSWGPRIQTHEPVGECPRSSHKVILTDVEV